MEAEVLPPKKEIMKNDIVSQHYKAEARRWGASPCSTMDDETIREKETELVVGFIKKFASSNAVVFDLGCGNGYTLSVLAEKCPKNEYLGFDICGELLQIANGRNLGRNCRFYNSYITNMDILGKTVDAIYTQRCLINLLTWEEQKEALNEIHRMLKPGGYYLMLECFIDGHENYNKARGECGLPKIEIAPYNKYIDKEGFIQHIKGKFKVVEYSNFLSTHYFIARVLHSLVTKEKQVKNTEFVKFFTRLLPQCGNYSPLQSYVLRRDAVE